MFNNNLSVPVPPLTRTYVNTLKRLQNEPDYSLVSLATALVKPRVSSYQGVDGSYLFTQSPDQMYEKIIDFIGTREGYDKDYKKNVPAFFYMLIGLNEGDIPTLRAKMKQYGMTELTSVENFVNQQLGITKYGVFINEESNSAFVIVGSTQMSLYHLSISFISLLYPALFKPQPLKKDEVEVLKGLTNKSQANFVERTSAILDYMKQDLLRAELAACFKGFRQGRINQCKRELDEANLRAENALDEYRRRVDTYNEILIRYEGLQIVDGDDRNADERETIEYLSSCKQIHDVRYANDQLCFMTNTLLTNFDVNKWRNAVRRSNIYDNYRLPEDSPFKDRNKRVMLLENIFNARPLLFVRVKGNVQLYITRTDMSAPRGQSEAEGYAQLKDCITNPHFKIHGCPGRNREQIVRCLRSGDVISAIECCIAATGSVNIDETEYTFRPFLQEILTSKERVLENASGEKMTPEEALLWLSKQNIKEETMPF